MGTGDAGHDGHGRGRGLHDLRRGRRSQGQDALLRLRPAQRASAADDRARLWRSAQILSGALLVEVIFSFPGIGTSLYHAIRQFDYFLIQGIVFTIVLGVTLATFILDLIYPLLDPRISYQRA